MYLQNNSFIGDISNCIHGKILPTDLIVSLTIVCSYCHFVLSPFLFKIGKHTVEKLFEGCSV